MGRYGPRPGVRHGRLTELEIGILQALSEGMTPSEIAAEKKGLKDRKIWQCLHRMRLKLGAYTNYEMMFKVGRERILE